MSNTIPVARLPSNPQTPANEWANETAMRLHGASNPHPNDIVPPPHVQTAPVQPMQSAMLPDVVPQPAVVPGPQGAYQPVQPAVDLAQKPAMTSSLLEHALNTNNNNQSAASTPGHELPGGWGSQPTSAVTEEKTTTIYEDVSNVLNTVGQTAFSILPESIKNSISSAPTEPGAPNAAESLSNASRTVADTTSTAATSAINTAGDASANISSATSNTLSAASNTLSGATQTVSNATSGLVAQAQETLANLRGVANTSLGNNAPSSSPLDLAAHTTTGGGVGNLPGPAGEASVAVLPDERASALRDTYVANPTQGTGGPGGLGGVGDLPGAANEGGVARLPDERRFDNAAPAFTSASGGVGDLPGGPGEAGVARLPDERALHQESQQPLVSHKGQGVGDLPGSRSEVDVAKLPEERANPATGATDSHAPMSTTSGAVGAVGAAALGKEAFKSVGGGGVGDLPGTRSETEVAKLPEERSNPATSATDSRIPPSQSTSQSTASAFMDTRVKTPDPSQPSTQKPTILESTIDPHPITKKDKERDLNVETGSTTSDSTAPPATPPKEHHAPNPSVITSPTHTNTTSTTGATDAHSPTTHSKFSEAVPKASQHTKDSSAASDADSKGEKKVGFREKLKGEMKVLSGKLTGNESKVVHGQAIKSGEMQH